jgi:hypothetical protein
MPGLRRKRGGDGDADVRQASGEGAIALLVQVQPKPSRLSRLFWEMKSGLALAAGGGALFQTQSGTERSVRTYLNFVFTKNRTAMETFSDAAQRQVWWQ